MTFSRSIGLVVAGMFGLWFGPADYALPNFADDIYAGFEGVVEITLLALFIGGLGALIKASGGLSWLAAQISRIARGNIFNALLYNGDLRSLIENATGGSGNDSILGNQAAWSAAGASASSSLEEISGVNSPRSSKASLMFVLAPQGASLNRTGHRKCRPLAGTRRCLIRSWLQNINHKRYRAGHRPEEPTCSASGLFRVRPEAP